MLHTFATQSARQSSRNPRKTASDRRSGCYTNLSHNTPVGLCLRGTQFYYRRRVPRDARDLIGRTQIWRSLRTDSLKVACASRLWRWRGSTLRSSTVAGWRASLMIRRFSNRHLTMRWQGDRRSVKQPLSIRW
ncbi:DUF6538 domain-containing protein [Sphingobium sp.]|uniref:DUF6538 domain-containing protein n=1 Tax=Sphingobium sp. TaxID=1912891 RepID=UPI00338D8460